MPVMCQEQTHAAQQSAYTGGTEAPELGTVTMIISPTELALIRHLEEELLKPEIRRSANLVSRLLADEFHRIWELGRHL